MDQFEHFQDILVGLDAKGGKTLEPTRQNKQTFQEILVGQSFQDILVGSDTSRCCNMHPHLQK
jgi:hypothetical protein